jgi:hypothetical protein
VVYENDEKNTVQDNGIPGVVSTAALNFLQAQVGYFAHKLYYFKGSYIWHAPDSAPF